MRRTIFQIVTLSILTSCVLVQAQTRSRRITGVIRDVNSHREISAVNVFIKDTQIGTTTNLGGRFSLTIPDRYRRSAIIFRHIAYDPREIPLDSVLTMRVIYLQPRVIQLRGITMEEERIATPEIEKDLPQTVSMVESKSFEIRGYVDAGDLLKTEHSVQVEEELSGKKTVSIRGGNPDEIVVLYNGIKMNSTYDNVFDFSLIDLEDVERFEIIKGSNTALYGPEAFSGVINIVPKFHHDYTVRAHQRFGTYQSGNWGVNLYRQIGRLFGSYSFKQGGARRHFVDVDEDQSKLENTSLHHTANVSYSFSEWPDGRPKDALDFTYMYSSLNYDNQRDVETLANFNEIASAQYKGDLGPVTDLNLSVSYSRLEEDQYLSSGTGFLSRHIYDDGLHVDAKKTFKFGRLEFLTAYQFKHANLEFIDERRNFQEAQIGLESATFQRYHHGFVSIGKLHNEIEGHFINAIDLSGSIRHDWLKDKPSDIVLRSANTGEEPSGFFEENEWRDTMVKFGLGLNGEREDLTFEGHVSFGYNTKFPTLFQQISSTVLLSEDLSTTPLVPEKNSSSEVSIAFTRDLRNARTIYGWQLSGLYFQNQYDNKFRVSTTPGIPIPFYDNVPDARISGFETKASVFLYRKKLTLEVGLAKYFISEKAAFPFKSDYKHTANIILNHAGYSFQVHFFKEGEQVGWLRQTDGSFAEVGLPDFSNMDLHLSKTFSIYNIKIFFNASGRNLLRDEEVILQGLAIRDRRYYITMGAQY